MVSLLAAVAAAVAAQPTVTLANGSYYGLVQSTYSQEFFLGIPYAQPPLGDLRLRPPQSLNTTWSDVRNATSYSPECYGYGSDDWVLGNDVSEDCLTINIIRPQGISAGADLPVAAWIHGGGYVEGGSSDPRYNLSFLVQQSVELDSPIIGVSFNYRLSGWGFMFSQELLDEGATNLGLRDQRLALHWIQENIGAFGGDSSKVTIWGESAGGNSVGTHLVAYGGRDDGLFRGAISESGAPTGLSNFSTVANWQPAYDAVVNATGCSSATDTLSCLRTVDTQTLSDIFNSTLVTDLGVEYRPAIDGDFLLNSGTTQIRRGEFVKVPYLIGTNFDEGTAFGVAGINTTEQFLAMVQTRVSDNRTAETLAALYPDIPEIGIPATLHGRPPPSLVPTFGLQWKRSAAYGGDLYMQAGRRLTSQSWAAYNVSSWSYHFDVVVNGLPSIIGSTHFQEVAFVFNNVNGLGYENAVAVNPFAGEPDTFTDLANIISRMWVSFVVNLDPNYNNATSVYWPQYTLDNPQNIVFDVNATDLAFLEPDTYRAEAIAYMSDRLDTVWGQ
ncbi:carboxylesterase family protein [Xylariales sp. PMI_506]|nr:carboxylesterase family protein [Xylariales sp. PMI_506]